MKKINFIPYLVTRLLRKMQIALQIVKIQLKSDKEKNGNKVNF